MSTIQRIPRTDKVHIASPANRAICLKFKAIVLIFSMFLIFNADSRAEGVEFQLIYLPLVYPTFFYASFCRIGRFRFGCPKR